MMPSAAGVGRRALLHATVLLLAFQPGVLPDSPACSLKSQLSSATAVIGGSLTTIIPSGCVLLSSAAERIVITSNTTVSGGPNRTGTLDTQFASNVVNASGPGLLLTLDSVLLLNAVIKVTPFLQLSAFPSVALRLSHVVIDTDCHTLNSLANASLPGTNSTLTFGRGYVYVDSFSSATVKAEDVNITCRLPQIIQSGGLEITYVNDSLQLINALVASQLAPVLGGSQGMLTIQFTTNITTNVTLWPPSRPIFIYRNVTVQGQLGVLTVWDLQAAVNRLALTWGSGFYLQNLVLLNAGPLRGVAMDIATLPLFSTPIWFFIFARVPTSPQVIAHNLTLILTPSEFSYFVLWTLVLTGPVSHLSELAAPLRVTTPIINLSNSTNATLTYSQLMGTGLDLYNFTLSALPPAVPHEQLVLDNAMLRFEFTVLPNMTHLPIYNVADLQAVLQTLQDTEPQYRTALYLLSNITIDPAIWPASGYRLSKPVLFVGSNNLGIMTWIDFKGVPNFIRAVGCAPDMYVYMQGLVFLNIANAAATPQQQQDPQRALDPSDSSGGTAALPSPLPQYPSTAAAASGTDLQYVSLYMSNIVNEARGCAASTLYFNQSTLVISYAEYKLVRGMVSRFLESESGAGYVLGSNVTFNRSTLISNNISFYNIMGWGWSGFETSITYTFPYNVPELYGNVYDPPGRVAFDEPLPPEPSPQESDSALTAWQVALIVIGAVVIVAAITGLIAWRVVSRLRHEVEAVKSATSDKKSSSASGEHEVANGAARLGSSAAVARGASAQVTGAHSASAATGGGGGGKGSQGAGGGTSDDSTAPQFDKPPLELLNSMMATLTQEMDDRHLTILEVIGQGGFGVVYKGMWKGLHVAVKTITFQDRVAGGEKAQHRAILEAAISSSLAHANVVTTYSYDIKPLTVQNASNGDTSNGSGQNGCGSMQNGGGASGGATGGGGGFKIIDKRAVLDWKLYLIQEYCDGGSLRTAILKRKFFDAKKGEPRMEMILDTCLELTGGLVHLHERNIIHGDLNPNNVLLKRDSTKKYGAICKIADFGLSIKMGADQSHISNMRRGTPFYTCPQILARGNMTKAADVYSMGVMMWEMYHSCMSYRSLPSGFQARENFPNFPRKAAADFARVVGACLDNEPSKRPTFAQLRVQLDTQLVALKRGELRALEDLMGADPVGDSAHLAACND